MRQTHMLMGRELILIVAKSLFHELSLGDVAAASKLVIVRFHGRSASGTRNLEFTSELSSSGVSQPTPFGTAGSLRSGLVFCWV
jgi:hypothetical protein